jgi:hypothetical protein
MGHDPGGDRAGIEEGAVNDSVVTGGACRDDIPRG